MHARYYNPNLGRFLSVDPVGGTVGISQSWNRYGYVLNNPLNLVDPFGLEAIDDCTADGVCTGSITVTADDPEPTVSEIRSTMLRIAGAGAEPGELPPDPILENGAIEAAATFPFVVPALLVDGPNVPMTANFQLSFDTNGLTFTFEVAPGGGSPTFTLLASETVVFGEKTDLGSVGFDVRGGDTVGFGLSSSTDFQNFVSVSGKAGFGLGGAIHASGSLSKQVFEFKLWERGRQP